MSMAQQYASYLERESHKAATPVKAEVMRQAAKKLYELDREVARLRGIEHRIEDAISVDVDVLVPTRDYTTMTPKDCYEAGMLDGGMAVREAILAELTPNQMLADAINVADSACRADIECECRHVGSHDAGHWYDTTQYDPTKYNPEIGDVIAIAVRYLEARGILIRKEGEPHVVTFACD